MPTAHSSWVQGEGDAEDPHLAEAQAECQAAVQEYEAELQQQYTLPAEAQQQLRVAVERCFDAACAALEQRHAALQETEQENARVLNSRCDGQLRCLLGAPARLCCHPGQLSSSRRNLGGNAELHSCRAGGGCQAAVNLRRVCALACRGDLPEDMAAAYEAQRRSFEGLQRNTAALAEALDRKLPKLRETVTRMAAGPAGVSAVAGGAGEEQVQQVRQQDALLVASH